MPQAAEEGAAPVRFALLQPSKKRRRGAAARSDGGADPLPVPVRGVFASAETLRQEEETQAPPHRTRKRIELLEDARAKVQRLKDEGNTLAEAGRFRAAMARWQEALGVQPDNATLLELLAQAAMAVYEDFQAVQFARKATELAPTWSDGFHTLARCQLNFGELTLALHAMEKTEEMGADRRDIQKLLAKQEQVLRQRDQEAASEVAADKLQVISCFKHLSLRAKALDLKATRDSKPAEPRTEEK
ncbi:hypothetical protein BBJ28_00004384 [Nothophytophthora sp. Chile5]|nr:hypothetical protein BBJ28_00004384 [Nothophytophthora sp. Chile5]